MTAFATALAPILMLILVGYGLSKTGFLNSAAWSGMEKLTYFVLFPALLVNALSRQRLEEAPWPPMLAIVAGTLTMAVVALVALRPFCKGAGGPAFTSVFQGGVRFNTYIAFAVAQRFFGEHGLAMVSVAAGFMIVLINLLCISAFALWGRAAIKGVAPFVRTVFGNPLIIGCAIGWTLSLSGAAMPAVANGTLEILGRAALPLGLLTVGAALRPAMISGHLVLITVSSLVQFGVKPLAVAVLIAFTGLTGVAAGALTVAFMTPTASSGYILARQLGGDTEAMASIITFQTLLAFVAMPLVAAIVW